MFAVIAARPAHGANPAHVAPDVAGVARSPSLSLAPPPDWDPAASGTRITLEDLQAEFARVTDTPPPITTLRTHFLRPDVSWLRRFSGWFRALQKPLKIRFQDEAWDCDNYANCFVAFGDLVLLRAGESRGALCIGWATVDYQVPFAGIAEGAHAVVIADTREGLFVIEPQDGTMVPLGRFPNRDTIQAVYF